MEIAKHWRLKDQRYGLKGNVCPHCEEKHFPPIDVCSNCGGTRDEDVNTPDSYKITTPGYNGTFRIRYATQEVQPYSEMMHPEITKEENVTVHDVPNIKHEIQIAIPSGVIYQEASLAG